jgi:di/tricarboxylate transporter
VTLPQIFVVLVLVIPLILVFMNKLREDVAGLLMAVLLGLAQFFGMGILGPAGHPEDASKALTGFGTPEVVTLIALFIVTYSLDRYGVTRWIAKRLLKIGGRSERRLIGLFAVTAALLSLFMNTLAAGALLLPSALEAARRTGIKPSKLLIPIAYGTMLGGAATYLTTANIVVSSLLPLADPPQKPLGVLDFTPTGGLVALAGLAFLAIFGKYLLPDREPPAVEVALTGEELSDAYQIQDRMWEGKVTSQSPLVRKSLMNARIGEALGMAVLGVRRGPRVIPMFDATTQIEAGDVLLLVGREERARQLEQSGVLVKAHTDDTAVTAPNTAMAEVLVPPRSSVEGKTLRELAFRARYGFTALALWRDKRSYRTDIADFKLKPGDSLLLAGPADRVKKLKMQNDFVVVETTGNGNGLDVKRVTVTLVTALTALGAAIFLSVPIELAMVAAVVVLMVTGLVKPEEAYSAIKWRAIFLIAGTISVSVAMIETGLANMVGDWVVTTVAPLGPVGLVVGTYILSAALTQVMGGQISPLVVGPITISAAIRLGISPQAIAVVTAIAGSVSFITPLSHPVNILMIAPANYTFADFAKSGIALTVICFVALVVGTLLFWPL